MSTPIDQVASQMALVSLDDSKDIEQPVANPAAVSVVQNGGLSGAADKQKKALEKAIEQLNQFKAHLVTCGCIPALKNAHANSTKLDRCKYVAARDELAALVTAKAGQRKNNFRALRLSRGVCPDGRLGGCFERSSAARRGARMNDSFRGTSAGLPAALLFELLQVNRELRERKRRIARMKEYQASVQASAEASSSAALDVNWNDTETVAMDVDSDFHEEEELSDLEDFSNDGWE